MTEFVGASGFIGNGSSPSIADIRIVSTFAFLPVIDYKLSPAAQVGTPQLPSRETSA
jgi:hypothetical protein